MLLGMPRSQWLCSSIYWDLPASLLHLKVKTLLLLGRKHGLNARAWWISHSEEGRVAAQGRRRVERDVPLRKQRTGNPG